VQRLKFLHHVGVATPSTQHENSYWVVRSCIPCDEGKWCIPRPLGTNFLDGPFSNYGLLRGQQLHFNGNLKRSVEVCPSHSDVSTTQSGRVFYGNMPNEEVLHS